MGDDPLKDDSMEPFYLISKDTEGAEVLKQFSLEKLKEKYFHSSAESDKAHSTLWDKRESHRLKHVSLVEILRDADAGAQSYDFDLGMFSKLEPDPDAEVQYRKTLDLTRGDSYYYSETPVRLEPQPLQQPAPTNHATPAAMTPATPSLASGVTSSVAHGAPQAAGAAQTQGSQPNTPQPSTPSGPTLKLSFKIKDPSLSQTALSPADSDDGSGEKKHKKKKKHKHEGPDLDGEDGEERKKKKSKHEHLLDKLT